MQEIKIFYNSGEILTINNAHESWVDGSWFIIVREDQRIEYYSAFSIERVVTVGDD